MLLQFLLIFGPNMTHNVLFFCFSKKKERKRILFIINPFSTNIPLLYPLKTLENRRFSDVFRGYRCATLIENELMAWRFVKSQKCKRLHTSKTEKMHPQKCMLPYAYTKKSSAFKQLSETAPRNKDVHWLHHKCYMDKHKSV